MGGGPAQARQRVARHQLLGRREPLLLESVPAATSLAAVVLEDLITKVHKDGQTKRIFFHESERPEYLRSVHHVSCCFVLLNARRRASSRGARRRKKTEREREREKGQR